ncbi:hypothetical protein [Nannocystis sp. SCPEA4]|uniref:hypothetical protein n=1 Tax=Nannocystis sp. SCPEA4 TaxID=2996787 RepID=UPI00226FD86C|nr:hypothetical protein [Nannocystis sp. SCPEA4]MCY1054530.1 hypothetical protein [Nannocystis sp. SCPEA4]
MALDDKCTTHLLHPTARRRPSARGWLSAVSAGVLFTVPASYSHAAQNSEQLVFSGIADIDTNHGPIGFWVWCQVEPASENSHYETDCQGAIRFYDLGIVEHVTGEVTEPLEGIYIMDLDSAKGTFTCELENDADIVHGPRNTVVVTCSVEGVGEVTGRSETAVVNATGPD